MQAPNRSLDAVIDHIFTVRRISRETQQQLMRLLLSQECISPQDLALVQRVLEALKQGRLQVVD